MGALTDLFVAAEEGFSNISKRFYEAVGSHKPDYKNNYIIPTARYIGYKLARTKKQVLNFYFDMDLPLYKSAFLDSIVRLLLS